MKKVLLIFITLLLFSCTKEDLSINDADLDVPVVQSYLEPHNPVFVKLTKMLPFVEGGNTGLQTIDSAQVFINHNGSNFLLSPIPNKHGLYECLDTNLQIIPNDSYKLSFEYNDYMVSATTIIPIKPTNTSLSTSIYYIDPNATGPGSTQDPLLVNWSNPDNTYYMVVVEYLEAVYNPINENLDPQLYDQFRRTSTDPINDNSTNLTTRQHLLFFGDYRVIVYKINDEYVDLYENISQNTLNMTEPMTNIVNGLGIFSGINSDTLFLRVKSL